MKIDNIETLLQSFWASFTSWYPSTDLKSILPLVGVVVGWILAQFTEIFRAWRRKRRLKKALYKELWDVGRRVSTTKKCCEELIHILADTGLIGTIPLHIPTFIFDTHYAEVSLDLSENERIAFTSVFALVKNLNSDRDLLEDLFRECITDPVKGKTFANVVDTMYIRSSRALIQGTILHEKRKRVPVHVEIDDDHVIKDLEALKKRAV